MHLSANILICFLFFLSCDSKHTEKNTLPNENNANAPFVIVLGTVQDGGSPHAGCAKSCCRDLFKKPDPERKIISLGLIEPSLYKTWLFEASPDLPLQLFDLNTAAGRDEKSQPDGIFLSHAHIGHYTGLMYLGREAMNTKNTTVYVMRRFKQFLENNGPWSQLVTLGNIDLNALENEKPLAVSSRISVTSFLVPHRDEYSETVGFIIAGPSKKILFIPDIDKWSKWEKNIEDEIRKVDFAFIDGTFYDAAEINNRPISEIPHPFVSESMERFRSMTPSEKKKIHFIHFNHTNALLDGESAQTKAVREGGFNVAYRGQRIYL